MRIAKRPQWGAWVTPKLLRQRPIYRWYVYPHSYDKELVVALLKQFRVDDVVAWARVTFTCIAFEVAQIAKTIAGRRLTHLEIHRIIPQTGDSYRTVLRTKV